MKLLEGHDADVAAFVARLSPVEKPAWKPGFRAFGVVREDGALVAGVVFDDWHPDERRIELSGAAVDPRAFGPQILGQLAGHVFGKLDCFRVWARTSTDNRRARRFLKGIGFREEGIQAHWYGEGRHAVMARVLRPEWDEKWSSHERLAA